MSDHEWCRDTARDEQVRAAEDAAAVPSIQHRDLPEQVALLWASVGDLIGRVVRLEGEMDAGQDEEAAPAVCDSVPPANGLRTERVTLEVTHRCVQPLADWLLQAIDQVLVGPGENVFVMDSSHEITKLTADLAASKRECERLRDVVRQLSVDQFRRVPIQRNESSTEAMNCMTTLRRERDAARARVAELEAAAKLAPAANAGGEANNPHESESLPEQLAYMMAGPFEKRVFLTREEVYAYRRNLSEIEAASMIFIPLYAAPQPPRGWLTAEERAWLENEASRISNHLDEVAAMHTVGSTIRPQQMRKDVALLRALLARETPPRVKGPTGWAYDAHDMAWIAAIRAAGGEVE